MKGKKQKYEKKQKYKGNSMNSFSREGQKEKLMKQK
jgi:hypothetical protein